jgi:hypothetical protein
MKAWTSLPKVWFVVMWCVKLIFRYVVHVYAGSWKAAQFEQAK